MDSVRRQAEALFQLVLDEPAERQDAFLSEQDDVDPAVRAEVERLLATFRAPTASTLRGPLETDTDPDALLDTSIGPYRLLETIGEGGFGTVYMAEQREPVTRRVALKIIKLGMDTRQVIARFEAERQALAMMDHPNIAGVLDAGATEAGRPYFVMELVRGVPITEYCDANRLPTHERLEILIDVCAAVQHAHQKGIIHRDLKPTNILVTLHDGRPVPKVIDFGIAKATSARLTEKTLFTEHRQMIGTPQYMSPEQAELSGLDIDTRTDIYSLGVLLYELLTGTPPFESADLNRAGYAEMQRIICEVEPPRPSMRISTMGRQRSAVAGRRSAEPSGLSRLIRGDLDWIAMTALEKDRQRRYETTEAMAADIRRYLEDQPVTAVPPSPLYRIRKFVRRNRVGVAAGLVVGAALLVATVASTYFASAARRGLQQAVQSEQIAREQQARAETARALVEQQATENARLLYTNMIRAAEAALENAGPAAARRLLEQCPPAERRWEWHWLDRIARDHGRPIGEHESAGLRDLEYSPDGRTLVSSGQDATARLWDADTGRLRHVLRGHRDSVTGSSFSPDGRTLATCGADAHVHVWDVETGALIAELSGPTSWLAGVRFDPTGTWLAACGGNSNLHVWDARTLERVHELGGYTHDVWGLDFSPDGSTLATSSGDGEIVTWDVASGTRRWSKRTGEFGGWSIRYSPDGTRLVVASFGNLASVWKAHDGEHLFDLTGFNLPVRSAEFAPDGRLILTGGFGAMRTFDAETGQPLAHVLSEQGDLHAIAFHPSGDRFAVAGTTREVREWDAIHVAGPLDLHGHRGLVFEAAPAPDGRTIYSAGADGTLRAFDAMSGAMQWLARTERGHMLSVDVTPDGAMVVATGNDGLLRAWDAQTGDERWARPLAGSARNVRMAPDGRSLAAGADRDGAASRSGVVLALWDVEGGTVRRYLEGHGGGTLRMDFDPTGAGLATTSSDGTTIIWDTATGEIVHRLTVPDRGAPNSVAFSPDGATLYVGHTDGLVSIWDAGRGVQTGSIQAHNAVVGSVCVSADGERVMTSAWHNHEVRVWKATTGELLLEIDSGTTGLSDARFLPDEDGLVTAGMGGRLRVWEMQPATGAYALRRATAARARADRAQLDGLLKQIEARLLRATEQREAGDWTGAVETLARAARAASDLDPRHETARRLTREHAWTHDVHAALVAPVVLSPGRLEAYAGEYEDRHFRVVDGRLTYRRDRFDATYTLLALDDRTFQARELDYFRVRFVLDDDGRPIAVQGLYLDGAQDESPRDDAGRIIDVNRRLARSDLEADTALLRRVLEHVHPGLHRYADEAQLDAAFERLESMATEGVTVGRYFLGVSELLAVIRCVHTMAEFDHWWSETWQARQRLFPLEFRIIDERWYVTRDVGAGTNRPIPPGTEILAIDDRPVGAIAARLLPLVPADGATDAYRRRALADEHFARLYPLHFGPGEAYRVGLRRPGATAVSERVLPAVTVEQRTRTHGPDPTLESRWRFDPDVGDDTALMTVGTLLLYKMDFDHEAFFGDAFARLHADGTRHLIVDLRGNGGGLDEGLHALLAHLIAEPTRVAIRQTCRTNDLGDLRRHLDTWDRAALNPPADLFEPDRDGYRLKVPQGAYWIARRFPRFDGHVTFLCDEANASAVTSFLGIVQDRGLGTIVGAPTGGSKEGPTGGVIFFLKLPRSGITVKIPGLRTYNAVHSFTPGRGIIPDVLVRTTPQDLVDGRDPAMELALRPRPE